MGQAKIPTTVEDTIRMLKALKKDHLDKAQAIDADVAIWESYLEP
jgi:hypothetical protein